MARKRWRWKRSPLSPGAWVFWDF
uniref:Uncharacterized protein n=1 Tax=Anguilla anguilla TaxID=7936 RepID=A0A0E9XD39_ANGAN